MGYIMLENRLKELAKEYDCDVFEEYRFYDGRKWRFDYVLICGDNKIGIEVEGGVFMKKARHTSPLGYIKDMQKYNTAVYYGWKVLRISSQGASGKIVGVKSKDKIDEFAELIDIIKHFLISEKE